MRILGKEGVISGSDANRIVNEAISNVTFKDKRLGEILRAMDYQSIDS